MTSFSDARSRPDVVISEWSVSDQGVALFAVKLSSPSCSHVVHRRFSEFVRLDKELRQIDSTLPQLPARSFFLKRLLPSFMEQRRQKLQDFLAAVLAKELNAPGLRAFLDTDKVVEPEIFGEASCDMESTCEDGDDGSEASFIEQQDVMQKELFTIAEGSFQESCGECSDSEAEH